MNRSDFLHFFARAPIFLLFYGSPVLSPSSKSISLLGPNNAPKMVATGSHCNHLPPGHTLHHWMHTVGDICHTRCNKPEMVMIQQGCFSQLNPILSESNNKWQLISSHPLHPHCFRTGPKPLEPPSPPQNKKKYISSGALYAHFSPAHFWQTIFA